MWYVYILLCSNGALYTGITNNIEKRFSAHIEGKGGKYTRSFKPQKVIYFEKHENRSMALKREIEIKSLSRKDKIKDLKIKI